MPDNFQGGQLATEHLPLGHQRIAYIFGMPSSAIRPSALSRLHRCAEKNPEPFAKLDDTAASIAEMRLLGRTSGHSNRL